MAQVKKPAATKKSTTKKTATKSAGAASSKKAMMVKAKPDAAEGLRSLFEDSLKDIYWAEKALVKELPKMAKNASESKLRTAIEGHLKETRNHVSRLEKVFKLIGKKAQAKKCDAMDGLLKEGKDILKETAKGPVRDAGIIAAGQKIEHYEIATYGTLCAFAKLLGEDKALKELHDSLSEEKNADESLSDCAYNSINLDAKKTGK